MQYFKYVVVLSFLSFLATGCANQAKLNQLTTELSQVRQSLTEEQAANKNLASQLADVKTSLNVAKQVNKDLAGKLKQSQTDLNAAKAKNVDLSSKLAQAKALVTKMTNELSRVRAELARQLKNSQGKAHPVAAAAKPKANKSAADQNKNGKASKAKKS